MIALDFGNGSLKWGRFSGARLVDSGRLSLDADPRAFDRDGSEPLFAVSVNPPVSDRWAAALPDLRRVGRDLPLPLRVYGPDCGHDRVCAVAGALREFEGALVLDAGTCLVATAGTRADGVLGGAILPGPELMARALATGTAALPRVEPSSEEPPIGRSTDGAIRAGIDAAITGAARELIRRVRAEIAGPLTVVATGTGGAALARRLPEVEFHRDLLPLWGLLAAAEA